MSALVFLDTETTGLSLTDDIWEFAAIKRYEDGGEEWWRFLVDHDDTKCARLPEPFFTDHSARYHSDDVAGARKVVTPAFLAGFMETLTRDRPHIVGAVPNFDTERLALLMWRHSRRPNWHHHLIDVEALAVGYLAGRGIAPSLPWNSDDLSRACGVEPPAEERHTAMGDARWAMALYDAIVGGAS